MRGVVTVGSCATGARESGQVRKEAAFNGTTCVLQIAWPLPHSAPVLFSAGGSAREHQPLDTLHEVLHAELARHLVEVMGNAPPFPAVDRADVKIL